ncbi:MAG: DUF6609 family protein [bacterium]|nr:hypothetical protein [Betaproteobacteria bacterium]
MVNEAVTAYPLMRGGGLMLICIGIGFLVAWFSGSRWYVPAVIGAVLGLLSTGLAGTFSPPLPAPSSLQISALVLAIVVETVLVVLVIRRYAADQERLILAVLMAVGVHFFIMIPSFGPAIGALAVLTVANSLAGWHWHKRLSWRLVGCVDSGLKIAVGSWMFLTTVEL